MKKIFFLFLIFFLTNSHSVEPDEVLENSSHEIRARSISKNIRCVVCQNQSIDESSATLARDLRILIRKQITDGYTDREIYDFLTVRYGDFILLNPPFKKNTLILWFAPLIFLFLGIFTIYKNNKNKK